MKVLICLDYSSYTKKVADSAWMVLGTRVPGPEIHVLHVIDTGLLARVSEDRDSVRKELMSEAGKVYELAKESFGEGMIFLEEDGDPKNVIDELTEDGRYDLVVIGTRGRSLIASVVLGSVAEHLLHSSKLPLLVIP